MEWFISAMIGGGIYDLLKKPIGYVGRKLKENLKEVLKGSNHSFSEEEYNKIVELLEKADERDLKTQEYFKAYLKSCEELKEILKNKETSKVQQKSEGKNSPIFNNVSGDIRDNHYGDNNTYNTYVTDDTEERLKKKDKQL